MEHCWKELHGCQGCKRCLFPFILLGYGWPATKRTSRCKILWDQVCSLYASLFCLFLCCVFKVRASIGATVRFCLLTWSPLVENLETVSILSRGKAAYTYSPLTLLSWSLVWATLMCLRHFSGFFCICIQIQILCS